MKNQLKLGVFALFCLLFVASCTQREDAPITSAQQSNVDFFTDLPDQTNARMADNDPFDSDATIRKRFVTFDQAGFQSAIARQSSINLQLFGDANLQVRTTGTKSSEGVEVWKGTVDGDPLSRVCLSFIDNNVMGTIQANGQLFRITPLGEGQHVIGEVIQRELPREACVEGRENLGPVPGQFGHTEIMTPAADKSTANTIRVMVVLADLGSLCNNSMITNLYKSQCEESLNDAWNNDQYTTGYTANVLIACTSYDPVGGEFQDDLNWVKNDAGIAMFRNMFQVDLVSLFVENGDACGRGNLPSPVSSSTSAQAFSVVKYSCAFDNYSFPHEVGHNLGMRHDRYELGGGSSSKCGYGYVYAYQSGVSGRSIMSYDTWCDDNGGDCDRVGLHSVNKTINLGFFSIKLGIGCGNGLTGINGSANNVSQFNDAAPFVAAYR